MKLNYTRIFADSDGESHFADEQIELEEMNFAPPAPSVNVSEFVPAEAGFLCCPVGWYGDSHPTPHKQFVFLLAGSNEMTVSDGEVRKFNTGDVVLLEDTSGKGHTSRVLGSTDLLLAAAKLPD